MDTACTYSPIQIGNYFIRYHGGRGNIGFVQLQKLVYFAHGWNLALTDEPLSTQQVEAWRFGPVFSAIYIARRGIPKALPLPSPNAVDRTEIEDEAVRRYLDAIFERYQPYSAMQLVAMTHAPGTPWHDIASPYLDQDDELPRHLKIPDKLIKEHFDLLRLKNTSNA